MPPPNPRWWWSYALAAGGLSVGMLVIGLFAQHSFEVAVTVGAVYGCLIWLFAIYKIAGFADEEQARQKRLRRGEQDGTP